MPVQYSNIDCNNIAKVINLPAPSSAGDAVSKSYVDGLTGGFSGKGTIDFGSVPTDFAQLVITGQTSLVADTEIQAWIQENSTVTNNQNDHLTASFLSKIYISDIVAGTGFTINMLCLHGELSGAYKVHWQYK